jgi:alpha-galactosidase
MKNENFECTSSMFSTLAVFLFALCFAAKISAETVWLDDLNVSRTIQGWGGPHKNQSVDGHGLSIGGQTFAHGLGTHAESILYINLKNAAQTFSASVGVDDEVNKNPASSIEFIVLGDGKILWQSGVMKAGEAAKNFTVNLASMKTLLLKAGDAGDGNSFDHADWADAKFETDGSAQLETVGAPVEAGIILTPAASPKPKINGAEIFGVRPGSPFLFTIAVTGDRPMIFAADNLPAGLQLDPQTGHITGTLEKNGEYVVTLRAKNSLGAARRKFKIVVGDQIALTPPMGWNSWNCFASAVSEEKVKSAADAMVKSGLINHGWTYINVDDFWQNNRDSSDPTLRGPFRDTNGIVVPNSRFPDMKGLADYIHNLGLKAGLYSSPGPWTCGGCAASWQHEEQDAQTYAKWGFDYLKYDWCSYGDIAAGKDADAKDIPLWNGNASPPEGAIYPFKTMGSFLREQHRDIVFSLCQYGMADVEKWGGLIHGNSWRTTDDITDNWGEARHGWQSGGGGAGGGVATIGFNQDKLAPYAKPGNWNDPDMLVVGELGWGNLHPTRLTPDEQYTHISLWCLLSAPLLIGCDMTKFDAFTLNLLSNDEVLALDQDALGKEAKTVAKNGEARVYAKDLADGSKAVGLFNLGETEIQVTVHWSDLGLNGKLHVRDLWRQKELGKFKNAFSAIVPRHGVVLIRVW